MWSPIASAPSACAPPPTCRHRRPPTGPLRAPPPSVQPRVDRPQDRGDRLLVEALEALAALEVLQVAADGPLAEEPVVRGRVDPAQREATVGAAAVDRPALAGGERLAEEPEV